MEKQLKSIMIINVGGDRVSYTYDELDKEGNPVQVNIKDGFYAVNEELQEHIKAIRDHIIERLNKKQ